MQEKQDLQGMDEIVKFVGEHLGRGGLDQKVAHATAAEVVSEVSAEVTAEVAAETAAEVAAEASAEAAAEMTSEAAAEAGFGFRFGR